MLQRAFMWVCSGSWWWVARGRAPARAFMANTACLRRARVILGSSCDVTLGSSCLIVIRYIYSGRGWGWGSAVAGPARCRPLGGGRWGRGRGGSGEGPMGGRCAGRPGKEGDWAAPVAGPFCLCMCGWLARPSRQLPAWVRAGHRLHLPMCVYHCTATGTYGAPLRYAGGGGAQTACGLYADLLLPVCVYLYPRAFGQAVVSIRPSIRPPGAGAPTVQEPQAAQDGCHLPGARVVIFTYTPCPPFDSAIFRIHRLRCYYYYLPVGSLLGGLHVPCWHPISRHWLCAHVQCCGSTRCQVSTVSLVHSMLAGQRWFCMHACSAVDSVVSS